MRFSTVSLKLNDDSLVNSARHTRYTTFIRKAIVTLLITLYSRPYLIFWKFFFVNCSPELKFYRYSKQHLKINFRKWEAKKNNQIKRKTKIFLGTTKRKTIIGRTENNIAGMKKPTKCFVFTSHTPWHREKVNKLPLSLSICSCCWWHYTAACCCCCCYFQCWVLSFICKHSHSTTSTSTDICTYRKCLKK